MALVNYRPITRYTFDRELERQAGKQILESMITESLINQEAKKQGIKVETKEIEDKIKEIEKQYGLQGGDLDNFLELQGQSKEDFEKSVKIQIIVEKILSKDIAVSEDESKKYFEENKSLFPEGSTFEEQKDSIQERLKQQKTSEKITPWLEELKNKAKINYFWK